MRRKEFITAAAILLFLMPSQKGMAQGPLKEEKGRLPEYKQPFPEEKRLIESLDGQLLFRAYCATCHGGDAKGGGPAASSLKKPPADLTRINQRNGGAFPAVRVQKTISGEDVGTAAHGDREMPIWGPIFEQIAWDQNLGNVRIYNLAKYIESLQQK